MKTIDKSGLLKDFQGILLMDKPASLSSYDVIRALKRFFFSKK